MHLQRDEAPHTETRIDYLTTPVLAVDVVEAGRRLGISERTVWERIKAGSLPAYQEGSSVRVAVEDLAAYVATRPRRAAKGA